MLKMLTENNNKLKSIPSNAADTSIMMKKIYNEPEKAKFSAFGKVKAHTNTKPNENLVKLNKEKIEVIEKNPVDKEDIIEELDGKIATELLSTQREQFEKEIRSLKDIKAT